MELTLNDFFCGCGGVGVGFIKAGYRIAGAWDFDKYAVETYHHNVDKVVKQQDIRKMTWESVPRASVWAFGFPCQDLSVAGKQAGFEMKCNDCGADYKVEADTEELKCPVCGSTNLTAATRSAMFFEMMRLIRETRRNEPDRLPAVLVAENVKGLNKYIPTLMQELQKNGYIGHIELYNSKYFDVAQNRERYYIIATRCDLPDILKMPSKQEDNPVPKLSAFLDAEVDEKYYIPDEKAQKIIAQALERLQKLGKVHPVITPDRINKSQNGRRAKESDDPMYTLTAQDIHGVIIDDTNDFGEDEARLYTENAPTLRASRQGLKVIEEEGRSYVERRLLKFVEEHGYIPKRFNPYNCTDIGELAPTATTQCGSMTTSATVLLIEATDKDGEKAIVEAVINDRGFVNKPPQVSEISPTLRAESHGNEPKVIVEKDDPLHGTVADPAQLYREGKYRIYDDTAPTLQANDHKDPRMVIIADGEDVEGAICRETGLLNPEGVGKTLRVGGGGGRCQRNTTINTSSSEQTNQSEKTLLPIVVSKQAAKFEGFTDTAKCLLARDYKGFGNQSMVAVLESCEEGGQEMNNPEIKVMGRLEQGGHDHGKRVHDTEGISPTLTAVAGGTHHVKIFDPKKYRVRKLTPTEYGRLQAFPVDDGWEQVVSDTQAYRQYGNAVTVSVAQSVAEAIKTYFNEIEKENE